MRAPDPAVDAEAAPGDNAEDIHVSGQWWFASTACPLLAATLGPMANGFSICALVYSWTSYIPPGQQEAQGVRLRDPRWLVAINAVSLAFALVGNATLLLNMAKRLRFSIAQPITIIGFFVAGALLIGDMATLTSSPTYFIVDKGALPSANHVLTGAYYYAIFAAALYMILALLMCFTVYAVNKGHYTHDFNLTPAQRTLMLQTMCYVVYLLIGALIYSYVEDWKYLDAVYWAQVTLLTVGLGDYSPQTQVGRGLLFPYAIGGILTVGLVVGSIRSLVLERGEEKLASRIIERLRKCAIHNTIKISWLAKTAFTTDPALTAAQRREEEFIVMRKVQAAAEGEYRYFSLFSSVFFALLLWFVGAVVFMACESEQGWGYFESLYFTFVVLMTIGYGDPVPASNSGKAFFVFWSLLAVPSLTILISTMGDTIVKWVTSLTEWLAAYTVLPEKKKTGFLEHLRSGTRDTVALFTAPGLLGEIPGRKQRTDGQKHYAMMLDALAGRLEEHVENEELEAALRADSEGDVLERDIRFYHYVLSRELRSVQGAVTASPKKKYSWHDWEYYLRLMGNCEDPPDFDGQDIPNILAPDQLKIPTRKGAEDFSSEAKQLEGQPGRNLDPAAISNSVPISAMDADKDGVVDRETERKNKLAWHEPTRKDRLLKREDSRRATRQKTEEVDSLRDWSWLSKDSPLMSMKSEAEWIAERLSAALVRELARQRKGDKRTPPISMRHVLRPHKQGPYT